MTLQRTAEEIASQLQQDGIDAVAYHAGMDTEERSKIQREFLSSSTKVVVATIAFGMGIDKPDIRYVYHFNAPGSPLRAMLRRSVEQGEMVDHRPVRFS